MANTGWCQSSFSEWLAMFSLPPECAEPAVFMAHFGFLLFSSPHRQRAPSLLFFIAMSPSALLHFVFHRLIPLGFRSSPLLPLIHAALLCGVRECGFRLCCVPLKFRVERSSFWQV